MKEVKLTQGQIALVDDEDFEFLSQWKWQAQVSLNTFYVTRTDYKTKKCIRMHRVIMKTDDSRVIIDHIDGSGLNNQKCNLRFAKSKENNRNRHTLNKNNKSGYKGVTWSKDRNKWAAGIKVDYKRIHLGFFTNKKDAAEAYNTASIRYFGEFAKLNEIKE